MERDHQERGYQIDYVNGNNQLDLMQESNDDADDPGTLRASLKSPSVRLNFSND